MTIRARWALLVLCLLLLAAPAGATAAVDVAPPSLAAGAAGPQAAATDPGCRSYNLIDFRERTTLMLLTRYQVRHAGQASCDVPTSIRCHATLYRGSRQISEIEGRGRDRCRMGSSFAASELYRAGTRFTQSYRYRLTLRRERHRWAGTSDFCPRRTNDRRTLICRDSHSTVAPRRAVERHF